MANFKRTKFSRRTKAQAFAEFAIIVPLFLLALTAIIEFGYAIFTWAAIGEVARIGTRYAVTGQFDPKYCSEAGATLDAIASPPGSSHLAADDLLDGLADCKVPTTVTNFEVETNQLQDWARLPSIRDAAINGGSQGLLIYPQNSGDYLQYVENPTAVYSQNYRGDPTALGFFTVTVCSNRDGVAYDPNPHYYNNVVSETNRYINVCNTNGRFLDDAGGPGDRIRVTVTYNHPLIIPFFNAMWPFLKMSTTQDGIVEKFRTSRVTGLTSGISMLPTWTPTFTATAPPPTDTPTSTVTSTPTATATPNSCVVPPNGNGLLGSYYAYTGSFTNLVWQETDDVMNAPWASGNSPAPNVPATGFQVRWTGTVYFPYADYYRWQVSADDGINLYIDGAKITWNYPSNGANSWKDQSETMYRSPRIFYDCTPHSVQIDYYQNGGGSVMRFGWINGMLGTQIGVPKQYLFSPPPSMPTSTYVTPTATVTSTVTRTPTITLTRTRTQTLIPSFTFTPSKTFTVTVTRTVTPIPSQTFTSTVTRTRPTSTRTLSPTPSLSPVASSTRTLAPTCTSSPDLGGC